MARMIPAIEPQRDVPGGYSEFLVYEALRASLDDEWTVYHGFRFLLPQRATQGEADFLVAHPHHGLLLVEVKGKGVRLGPNNVWFSEYGKKRERLKRSPIEQAAGAIDNLVARLRDPIRRAVPRTGSDFPFIYGWAVCLPQARFEGEHLPLDVDPAVIWDVDDLPAIGERVENALGFWTHRGRERKRDRLALDRAEFERIHERVLAPELGLVSNLAVEIAGEDAVRLALSREQMMTIDTVIEQRIVRVRGGAGTGKTVLSLEVLRRLVERGERVLWLCFNRALARHVQSRMRTLLDPAAAERTTCLSFHQLCRRAWEHWLDEQAPQSPRGGTTEEIAAFWSDEYPLGLLEAATRGRAPHFDAVIVDEGQDFDATWWDLIDTLWDPERGRWIVFHDPAQNIFGRGDTVPRRGEVMLVSANYRNTRAIGEVCKTLGELPMHPHPRAPLGVEPEVTAQRTPEGTANQVDRLVARLLDGEGLAPEQVVVMTPHSRPNSLLAGRETLGGRRLASDPLDRGGCVLHTTIGRFKGLESDVVILADIDLDDPRCNRNARYVAASRARSRLYVFARGQWIEPSGS